MHIFKVESSGPGNNFNSGRRRGRIKKIFFQVSDLYMEAERGDDSEIRGCGGYWRNSLWGPISSSGERD